MPSAERVSSTASWTVCGDALIEGSSPCICPEGGRSKAGLTCARWWRTRRVVRRPITSNHVQSRPITSNHARRHHSRSQRALHALYRSQSKPRHPTAPTAAYQILLRWHATWVTQDLDQARRPSMPVDAVSYRPTPLRIVHGVTRVAHLDEVHRHEPPRLGQLLADVMYLTVAEPAARARARAGREVRVDGVNVEREMERSPTVGVDCLMRAREGHRVRASRAAGDCGAPTAAVTI